MLTWSLPHDKLKHRGLKVISVITPSIVFLILNTNSLQRIGSSEISSVILLYEKFLQFDWLRAMVFQLNLKYLHVKLNYKPFAGSSINK